MRPSFARMIRRWLTLRGRGAHERSGSDPEDTIKALEDRLAAWQLGWPPGHFYSPLPDLAGIRAREADIFGPPPRSLPGIELNEATQLALLERLAEYYPKQPFADRKQPHLRFYFDNPNFSYGEAIVLYCMLRHLRPKRVIEIGSDPSIDASK